MKNTFHRGELEVQAKAGVAIQAQRVSGIFRDILPPIAIEFMLQQQLVIVSSMSEDGNVWASVLLGPKGFIHSVDERVIEIETDISESDPLYQNLRSCGEIGLLVVDLANRKRMKVKGNVAESTAGSLIVQIERVYSLCHKYIQAREAISYEQEKSASEAFLSQGLNESQQNLIKNADTFFIASYHPETGADAAHRGGAPGLVKVLSENSLIFPDYQGNNLFNTLGNITANPSSGVLFLDFESGGIVQLSGKAEIIWGNENLAEFPGAKRLIQFDVEHVIDRPRANRLRWRFLGHSPHNPGSQDK